MRKSESFLHSITIQIILVIFSLLLPAVFLSGYINYRFARSGMEQVERSHAQLLESYIAQIDRELDLAQNYMNSLTFYNSTTVYLTDRSSPNFYYSANAIKQEISKTALYYQYISGFFLRIPDTDFRYTCMIDRGTLSNQAVLNNYIDDCFVPVTADSSAWQYVQLGGGRYLMQVYQSNGIWGGSFLSLDSLPDSGMSFCMDSQLEEIGAELPAGSVLLSSSSQKCGLVIYKVLDQREIVGSLPFLQRNFAIITIFIALTIPLVYFALRHLIIRPLLRLTGAMRKLEMGDLDIQLSEGEEHTWEFKQIIASFNLMTRQIKALKIAVYEEQLQTEKTRLQNLSYQLRPHFMVNSLNMVYNMITCKDYASALRLIRFSASYMRYLLRTEDDFVPLQEELHHIDDYMNIQSLRYEDQFDYHCSVEPFVEDISIPSMILQNFIENSLKYSISPEHFTEISLSVDYRETDCSPYACITVRDNGDGYPDWLLEALTRWDLEALRDRVGLRNTLQRIRMLYGDKATCSFFNDNGAVTQFCFPLDME